MKIIKLPLEWFTQRLSSGMPFAFSRYGDGEFQAILGHQGRTKDGQTYTPELRAALANTLLFPGPYKYAVGPMAMRMHGPDILAWLEREKITLKWYDTETFLEASINGALLPFIGALRERRVVYFGPPHLDRLLGWLPKIRVRHCNAHNAFAEFAALNNAAIDRIGTFDVMLFSCGPTSKVLIHELNRHAPGLTLIDIGSLFDPYCGVRSRSYMNARDWKRLAQLNFGDRR